ncbi:MAG: hypothetical protein ACRDJ3_09885 [Solirubrobacteraceae bacterium]
MQRLRFREDQVEYRGRVEAGGEFEVVEEGKVVKKPFAPLLRFEYEDEDGVLGWVEVRGSSFDKLAGVDFTTFKPRDRFALTGVVLLQDKKSEKNSYIQITQCVKLSASSGKAEV